MSDLRVSPQNRRHKQVGYEENKGVNQEQERKQMHLLG